MNLLEIDHFIRLYLPLAIASFFPILFIGCSNARNLADNKLYDDIDYEIEQIDRYQGEKEKRLDLLRNQFNNETNNIRKAEIGELLIDEFESYNSDSAIYYVNLNLINPEIAKDRRKIQHLQIRKADITAHAGLFQEAASLLEDVTPEITDTAILRDYYSAYCDLYQYQSEYTIDNEYLPAIEKLREEYIDSLTNVSDPNSITYVVNKAGEESRKGNLIEAENRLLNKINEFKSGDRNYSILASILADVYHNAGDKEKYKYYIGQSMISDLRGSIKENMAARALARICYEEGDLEHAERYLRQSFADANFFAARMRTSQSSRMVPIIGDAYHANQIKTKHSLRAYIIVISILAGILILIIIYTILQILKVKKANKNSTKMLLEVAKLSENLKAMNKEVTNANNELMNSNKIKEEYAGLFMQYCSLAISRLEQYHQSLRVLAAQGNTKNLQQKIDSTEIENKLINDFYARFDEAILKIYPDFIEKFNQLLQPEFRITVRNGESLNTELRIFALIRLGISDSEKIAEFLRCSLSTIYTYRSKMKKRSIDPDSFEDEVKNIE